jgi:hypothetical protein
MWDYVIVVDITKLPHALDTHGEVVKFYYSCGMWDYVIVVVAPRETRLKAFQNVSKVLLFQSHRNTPFLYSYYNRCINVNNSIDI